MEDFQLDSEIAELTRQCKEAQEDARLWKGVWEQIKRIGADFKETRYPSHAKHQAAWLRFQVAVSNVKEAQQRQRREAKEKARKSEGYKDAIIEGASSARPLSALESALSDIVMTPFKLVVDGMTLGLLSQQVDERKEELQACSRKMKAAWDLLEEHKEAMLGRDKHEAFQKLRDVQDALDSAWAAWKESNHRLYESKREAYQARKQAALERKAAFEDRVNANIGKLEGRRDRLQGVLRHKENHLDELRDKRDSAWNGDFRARVEGWIDEEENAIDDIRRKIDEIESWIEEEKHKLR